MPVTKTAKRARRSSLRKKSANASLTRRLEIAIRHARQKPTADVLNLAVSLTDRAAKKKIIHKNKAARIKSQLSKLVKPAKTTRKATSKKKK
ncbi:hypothetical protein A2125_01525 [Candidatus Woesebacteria bacterium GWB1_43_5]|uniref:Small ribosomal subunit protein bS20 n=1 Tax=Candidatus Woesebacteria bacterium GWB1_43_5 TaxID=1802474 RepID=A0A1F7WSJ5_9BACT|nr:MAG: hypothetical protein A2125_01525 [Candidatus Woesebacteria bacterium GWB1_43_5]